jgi:integrase/recombinase XerD
MKIYQAAKIWIDYHMANSKKNNVRAYSLIINKFCADFKGEELTELPSEKVLQFFNIITAGFKPQTKRVRFTHLSSFFNFLKNNLNLNFQNTCDIKIPQT